MGLAVKKCRGFKNSMSLFDHSPYQIHFFSSEHNFSNFSTVTNYSAASVSFPFFLSLNLTSSAFFSINSISFNNNSSLIICMSLTGSTSFSVWVTSGSSKALTTWKIASHSLIWDKNAFPNPSPL